MDNRTTLECETPGHAHETSEGARYCDIRTLRRYREALQVMAGKIGDTPSINPAEAMAYISRQALGHYYEQFWKDTPLQIEFNLLAYSWLDCVSYLSDPIQAINAPQAQRLIAIGRPIVPLIIQWFREGKYNSFFMLMLNLITGASPTTEEHRGYIGLMKHDWISWWEKQNASSF